jgi:hypothetical protein
MNDFDRWWILESNIWQVICVQFWAWVNKSKLYVFYDGYEKGLTFTAAYKRAKLYKVGNKSKVTLL